MASQAETEADQRLAYRLGRDLVTLEPPSTICDMKIEQGCLYSGNGVEGRDAKMCLLDLVTASFEGVVNCWDANSLQPRGPLDSRIGWKNYSLSSNGGGTKGADEADPSLDDNEEANPANADEKGLCVSDDFKIASFDVSGPNASANVALGGEDGSTSLWQYSTGKCLQAWLDHSERVTSVKIQGGNLYSSSNDGVFVCVRGWNRSADVLAMF